MTRLAVAALLVLVWGGSARAHRLDEYLQATTLAVEPSHIRAQIRLTPGVAVFPRLLPLLDTNGDGAISAREKQVYADRVRGEVSLTVDSASLPLRLVASSYAPVGEMRQGRGEIVLDLVADVPPGSPRRHLTFTNHHQSDKAVYLVNGLVPRDPAVQVTGQSRSYDQSVYQMDYTQTGANPAPPAPSGLPASRGGLGAVGLVVITALALGLRRRAGA